MRRRHDRTTRTLVVGLVAAFTVAACASNTTDAADDPSTVTLGTTPSSEPPSGPPQAGGALSVGVAADTNSLTPGVGQWASSAFIVANAIYDPLAARAVDGTVQPYLAEAITPNDDFTEWTIELRPGISFHDGSALDAAAVVANLEFTRSAPLAGAALEPITSVSAVDALTVRISMSRPWSTFSNTLTAQPGYMAAPSMFEAEDPGALDPVGTGPFVFRSRVVDTNVVVERNQDYWQEGRPHLDMITFDILPDASTRAAAMQAGDLDAMEINTPEVLADYLQESEAGRAQLQTSAGQESNEFVVALNTSTPPFDDLLARQVLAAGIDQEELAAVLTDGVWPAAWGNFEEGSPFYVTPEDAGYPLPDPARAQELADRYVDEHGEPLSFTFTVNADAQGAQLGQFVEQQLAAYGISVAVEQVEQVKSITDILTGNYQAGFFAMLNAPTLDSGYAFIATEPAAEGLSRNHTRLDDPEIRRAMDAARATGDEQERIDEYVVVQQRMAENLDRIFLYHVRSAAAFTNQVHGFGAATFPDTDERAFAPDITYPFFTEIWVER